METFTRDTWLSPPHNRKTFQHVSALFPTSTLKRNAGVAVPFSTDRMGIDHIEFSRRNGDCIPVQQMLVDTYTDALLIVRNGTLVHEHYDNDMGPDSLHLLNSVSKTFLGMLAGILVEDGTVDLDARVVRYVPELSGSAFAHTTVRQALDMTGAVKFHETYADPNEDFWMESAVVGWRPDLAARAGTNALKAYAASRTETEQTDGAGFHYRTLLTNIVTMVLEGAAQQPVQDLMQDLLWQKLNPEQDANIVVDGTGFPYFGAGMSMCARDLARFGQLLMDDGKVGDAQIVPADWVKSTLSGSDERRAQFAATDYSLMLPGWHYQNQTWASATDGVLLCLGIFGQMVYVHKPSGMVIVKLSTHPEPSNDRLHARTFRLMRALIEELA